MEIAVLKKAEGQTWKKSNSSSKINKSNTQATYRKTFGVLVKIHFSDNTQSSLYIDLVQFVVVWVMKGQEKK